MIDVDLRAGAPLVLVLLEDTCLDVVAVDELSCEAEADELFDEELMTFDDELFTAEGATWPRVAVTEVLVLELLMLDEDFLLELLETFLEDVADDFAEVETTLTVDACLLDVLVAELRMHLHAFVT